MYSCVPLHQGCADLFCIISVLVNPLLKQALISIFHFIWAGSCYRAQAGLELANYVSPSKSWNHGFEPPHLAFTDFPPSHYFIGRSVFAGQVSIRSENERDG